MFRKTVLFTLVLSLVLIILGSYVRSSGVELGCPDWPGCYGKALVSSDNEFIKYAEQNFPYNRVDLSKAKKEMALRYLTAAVAVFILVLALVSWTQKKYRLAAVVSTSILLLLVALQVAMSMWVVEFKGTPVIVTAYLLLGFGLYWGAYWLYLRSNKDVVLADQSIKRGPKLLARIAMVFLFLQIVLGAWTSTNGAALSCAGFPLCNDVWLPAVDYLRALDLFSGLSRGYTGVLAFDGQVAIHWMHRVGAAVCFLLLTAVMLSSTTETNARQVRKAGLTLSILLLVQMFFGILIIKMQLPLMIAMAHSLFAVLLMLPLINVSFYSKYALVGDDELETSDIVDVVDVVEARADAVVVEEEIPYVEPSAESLYLRLKTQLSKTRSGLGSVLLGQKSIDDDLLEEIEASLLMADIGVDATTEIISQLTERLERHQLSDGEALEKALKDILLELLQPCSQHLVIPEQDGPFVILVVGINGVGKTTTIGKLAKRLQIQGHSVMLAAGDTFRAAAVEQLETWGERNNIHVVAQHTGADSASVIFDGVQSAKAKGVDVLIADTAGRLHTKSNLMDELSKIKRIMGKVDDKAPHEVLLVLDAGTGQNALSQTKIFNEVVKLSGLALTKLDGTAKGGVIFALAKQFGLPIRFIGVGEGIDDLQDFDAKSFVDALFVKD